MKIQKKYQGAIPLNRIANEYNESEVNTYSTQYLNNKLADIEKNSVKTRAIWSGHLYDTGTEYTQSFTEPLEVGKLYMFVLLGLSSSYRMTIPYIHGTGNAIQHSYDDGTTLVRWRININTDGTGFYLDDASIEMGVSTGVLAVYKVN